MENLQAGNVTRQPQATESPLSQRNSSEPPGGREAVSESRPQMSAQERAGARYGLLTAQLTPHRPHPRHVPSSHTERNIS